MRIPGLTAQGDWDLPDRLNMARQVLDHRDDALAVIDLTGPAHRDVSYGALAELTDGIARALLRRVRSGDRVGVLLSQSPWCLAAHLAIWKIGAISVPLFKLFKYDALASRVLDAGCEIVLTDPEGAELLADLAAPWMADKVGIDGDPVEFAQTTPQTPAILIYTSGTTGKPKGALHGHRVLTGHLPSVYLHHDHLGQPGDVMWTPADWAWIGGLFNVAMSSLTIGVPVVAARMSKFTPEGALEICRQAKVRNVFFPPTGLRMLKAADASIPGLRSVASGGEPLGAEMLAWGRDAFGLTINEFYGQTEYNLVISSSSSDFAPHPGSMGKPTPGFEVEVLDAHANPTTAEGDIAVHRGAASEMLEYWGRSEATAEKYVGDWLITGDRGQWEGAFLRFVGREDDVISSAGYRIGPAEIEDCLLTHPGVATCGVVGKPDPLRTEIVKAYVVKVEGFDVTGAELQSLVKDRLASYSYPREIEFVSHLPMTVTGKVIRKELKARAALEGQGA